MFWSKNLPMGQNKDVFFFLKHSPTHLHKTNLTDLWLLVIPQTLINYCFLTIIQKIAKVFFFQLHQTIFFDQITHKTET